MKKKQQPRERIKVEGVSNLITVKGIYWYKGTPFPKSKEKEFSLGIKQKTGDKKELELVQKLLTKELFKRLGATQEVREIRCQEMFDYVLKDYEHKLEQSPIEYKHKIAKTLEQAKNFYKHLRPYFGHLSINSITETLWKEYEKYAQAEAIYRIKRKRDLSYDKRYLVRALSDARRLGKLTGELPRFKVSGQTNQAKQKEKIEIFTPEEMKLLYENASGSIKGLILGSYKMGLRPIEVFGTKWEQVDFEKQTYQITIEQAKRNETKSAARTVRINPTYAAFLKEIKWNAENKNSRKRYKTSQWIYPSRGYPDRHLGRYNKQWDRLLEDLKIPHRVPYCLRHTAITEACKRLVKGQASLVELAKYFGTSVDEIETTYLHFDERDTQHVATILDLDAPI